MELVHDQKIPVLTPSRTGQVLTCFLSDDAFVHLALTTVGNGGGSTLGTLAASQLEMISYWSNSLPIPNNGKE